MNDRRARHRTGLRMSSAKRLRTRVGPCGRPGSTSTWTTGSARATWTGGCSRRACCAATAAAATSPSRTAAWSGSAAGPATWSTTAGSGPKGLYGSTPWASSAGPADPAAGPRGRAAGRDRLGDGDGPHRGGVAAAAGGEGPAERTASTPAGQLFLEEYYTLARDRQGRARHPAHGRQHPAVHRDRGGGDEGVLRRRRPARVATPTSSTATRSSCTATTWPRPRRCCGPGSWTAPAASDPPAHRLRRPAPHRGRRGGRAHRRGAPGAARRHQPGPDERPDPRAVRQRLGRRRTGSREHTLGVDELRGDRRAVHARAGGRRSAASTPDDVRRAARIFGTSRAGALHRAAGLLPVPPGHRGVGGRATTCTCCAA